jgi:hypothetical protein
MVMSFEEVPELAPQRRSGEVTSWTGLLELGARIPVREPWSTPSTMIRCMIAWALTDEAARARAEMTEYFMIVDVDLNMRYLPEVLN